MYNYFLCVNALFTRFENNFVKFFIKPIECCLTILIIDALSQFLYLNTDTNNF